MHGQVLVFMWDAVVLQSVFELFVVNMILKTQVLFSSNMFKCSSPVFYSVWISSHHHYNHGGAR